MNKNLPEQKEAHLEAGLNNAHESGGDGEIQMPSASSQLWRSHISWRITLTVFLVIVLVQGGWLYRSVQDFEAGKLAELKELGRTAIIQHLAKSATSANRASSSFLDGENAQRIIDTTPIKGITVYRLNHEVVDTYGEAATLRTQALLHGQSTYRSADLNHYEVIYTSVEMEKPFNIVAVMDSSGVQPAVTNHMEQTIVIILLMAGLVTSILMLAMGQWLLEPILLLRNNLLNAARNPKNPNIRGAGKESRDEIGVTLRIANDLIRQNANHMKHLELQTEDKIHRLAYYDTLTGLPNRTFFIESLEETIKQKVLKEDKRLVVFSIDIDHFKDINDTMGHEVGDKLLEAIGKRLKRAVPDGAVVARSSADEFSVMVQLNHPDEDGSVPLNNIRSSMTEPVSVLQEKFQVRVSIGVANCPADGKNSKQILKNADIALNRAKSEGRDTVRYYSEDFDLSIQKRFQMLRDLRLAIAGGHLMLYYHPQFDLASGAMIGMEALLRWKRPDNSPEGGTLVPPLDFIPIAEQSGLIVPIGEWVLRTACQTNKMWQERGGPSLCVAVNISGVQFHHGNIVEMVSRVLLETGLEPKYLELEVTESVFMEDMDTAIDVLKQLHELGVRLAIDDFGTGYSSLSYLRQFPVDRLKIDQSFTRNALINAGDATITKAIITLGHSLGLKVIAEGVETSFHIAFLRQEGCDEAQGFKYTKPLPADKFWDYAVAYNRDLLKSNLYVIESTAP